MAERKLTRREQAEQTRHHIFRCALELLEERDFEDIKIKEIVAAANVSVGSFYNYFHSKLDVYCESFELVDKFFAVTVAEKLTQPTARERILCFFDEYARYCDELTGIKLTRLLFTVNNPLFERQVPEGIYSVLLRQVRFGQERGELQPLSAELTVQYLLISARGLVYNWCTRNGDYDLREIMGKYVSRLLKAL